MIDVKITSLLEKVDLEKALTDSLEEVIVRIKRRTPIQTGKLRDGFSLEKQESNLNIINTQDYVDVVEQGNSSQAPQGMIRISLLELQSIINSKTN